MDELNHSSLPADFDPHYTVYALKGLADLVFEFHTEGPGVFRTLPSGQHVTLIGLAWMNRRLTRELVAYLAMLDEAGHKLPEPEEVLPAVDGVREPRAVYAVA